jgi:hypothetical protein
MAFRSVLGFVLCSLVVACTESDSPGAGSPDSGLPGTGGTAGTAGAAGGPQAGSGGTGGTAGMAGGPAGSGGTGGSAGGPFLVLQRTYFPVDRPTDDYFSGFGIKPLTIVYQNEFGCPPNNEATTRAASLKYQNEGYDHRVFLDDECIPPEKFDTKVAGTTDKIATDNMNAMRNTVLWFKDESPGLKVGVYSYAPLPVETHYKGPGDYNESTYKALNDLMQPLADSMDFLSPSIYSTYADVSGWEWKARVMIGEARRLANGKPVYAFISPEYYRVPGQTGMVSHDYWKGVLETTKDAGAKGAVIFIWSDAVTVPVWDSNAGWWTATKEFMQANQ